MRLYFNTTSPFARLVRLAIAEKNLEDQCETEIVDPWSDSEAYLAVNPAGRVPVLTTDDGCQIAEAGFILRYLDEIAPPAIFPSQELGETLAIAAIALGATEAATSIMMGRKSSEAFDTDMIGTKRHRTMRNGLARLDAKPPRDFDERPDIANIAVVTAIDYINFRFSDRDLMSDLPKLAQWRERQKGRPSVDSTVPSV